MREYDYNNVEKDIEELAGIADKFDPLAIVRKMKDIVPEFKSMNSEYQVLDAKN